MSNISMEDSDDLTCREAARQPADFRRVSGFEGVLLEKAGVAIGLIGGKVLTVDLDPCRFSGLGEYNDAGVWCD